MASTVLNDNDDTWKQYLNNIHHECPVSALTTNTVKELANYLDMEIRCLDNGLQADYTGLAAVVGLNFGFVEPLRHLGIAKPTVQVIREWQKGQYAILKPTIGNLVRSLIQLNRIDVVSDCQQLFYRDAEDYLNNLPEVSITNNNHWRPYLSEMLTIDDIPGKPALYDAFVCCSESIEDSLFVEDMIQMLQHPPFNLRLYVPKKNGLFGVNKYEADARIMEERCKHIIIILSPEYDNCEDCTFQTSIAIGLFAKDQSRRIVPVLLHDNPGYRILQFLRIKTPCNFTEPPTEAEWLRLAKSVCRFNIG